MMMAFTACILGMVVVHWRQARDSKQNLSLAESQSRRQAIAQNLVVSLQKYRSLSASFRRMGNHEINTAKANLKTELLDGLKALEGMEPNGPNEDDRALVDQVRNRFGELLVLSAKLEPVLYSKDVFQKAEVLDIHKDMIACLERLIDNAAARAGAVREAAISSADRSSLLLLAGAFVSIVFVLLMMGSFFWWHIRPVRFLRERVAEIRRGAVTPKRTELPHPYGEFESVMRDLVITLDAHRRDRLQFVTAVTTDLRPPLIALRSASDLIASAGDRIAEDRNLRSRAIEAVRRALYRLSAVLEGLNDVLDGESEHLKLEEKIVDVGELVRRMARLAGAAGSPHEIRTITSTAPAWASVDPERLERVLIYLVSKLILMQPQGGKFLIELVTPEPGVAGDLEIAIYDGEATAIKGAQASGPEQDLLRHWATQNGFGMSLAERIMRAHGGSVTVSGVAGTRVVFRVRIPKERVAIGLISMNLASYQSFQPQTEQAQESAVVPRLDAPDLQEPEVRPGLSKSKKREPRSEAAPRADVVT